MRPGFALHPGAVEADGDDPVTLEFDTSLCAPPRESVLARPRPAVSEWELPLERWEALEPAGAYARHVRGPFLLAVTLALLPAALVLALPVALVNAWVQRSFARIFFLQARVGHRGRVFTLWKFRTMRDGPGSDQARVTRFGRFLRNTHLDELPQLVNVLRGEMSLIGPRPEMVATERWAAQHCPGFAERLCLKPGLTGYAQITQGYTDSGDEVAYEAKRVLNRRYRHELSFATDCAILARTVVWVLRARGWRRA